MTTTEQAVEFLERKISKDPYSADVYKMAIAALKKQKEQKRWGVERCVFCGEIIPEGRQMCGRCKK